VHYRAPQPNRSLLSRYAADYGSLLSRRKSELALRAAAVESAVASRAKSEFLANMSHELRTPLNAIIGFSDLLQHPELEHNASPRTLEYAKIISQAGNHLLGIICDILDMSKIESGTFDLDLSPHSIREALEASVAIVRPRLAAKKQECRVVISDEVPPFVFDRRRIVQAILNLLTNAHKFTSEGGKITVTAASQGDSVIVCVADTGVGMSADQILDAMKPFGQVKTSYNRTEDGTGLGLPLTRALIEEHGGTFFLSSEPGVGTRATFLLPQIRPAASDQITISRHIPESVGTNCPIQ